MRQAPRALVLGDSLTFGRPKHRIFYNHSWPGRLEATGINLWHRARGGMDSKSLLHEIKDFDFYMNEELVSVPYFDFCIVQVGIVDCTPRLFSRMQRSMLHLIPGLGSVASKLEKNKFLLGKLGGPWVDLRAFERNFLEISYFASRLAKRVLVIEIARPANFLLQNCGDYSQVVREYNSSLERVFGDGYVRVYNDLTCNYGDLFLPDGHHLTIAGHNKIYMSVLRKMSHNLAGGMATP